MSLNSTIFGESEQAVGAPRKTRTLAPKAQFKVRGSLGSPKIHTPDSSMYLDARSERSRAGTGKLGLWASFLSEQNTLLKDCLNSIRSHIKWIEKIRTWKKDYMNLTDWWSLYLAYMSCELNFWLCCMCLLMEKSGASLKKLAKVLGEIIWRFQARRLSFRKFCLVHKMVQASHKTLQSFLGLTTSSLLTNTFCLDSSSLSKTPSKEKCHFIPSSLGILWARWGCLAREKVRPY